MYHLKTNSLTTIPKEKDELRKYVVSLERNGNNWVFFVDNQKIYFNLVEILRKYCVLSDFSSDFETNQILGKGHFAEVFSVREKKTQKCFAAKIIKKEGDGYEKSKVFK